MTPPVRALRLSGTDVAGGIRERVATAAAAHAAGRPLAQLLLARDATVTICHSRTARLADHTRAADVLVAAAGLPALVTAEHVTRGTVVIDLGTNPTPDGGLVGDVDAASVEPVVAGLSPVPGGVGPVTTALLLQHVVAAADPDTPAQVRASIPSTSRSA